MPFPNNADRIVVRGFWWDETTQAGVGGTITFDPVPLTGTTTPNVRDATSYGHIKTRQRIARPDATTGYYAAMLLSSNDPDLDAYGGRRVTFSGETPFIIEVPYNAPTITVDAPLAAALPELHVGDHVKAVWLVDAALVTTPPPTPLTSYLSSEQTLGAIADGVEAHDGANDAHPDIRAAITAATYSTEQAQDAAAALFASQAGKVSATYDDAAGHVALDVTGLTKSDVGLNNVNNTADANKPVSTSQQAAIDAVIAGVPEQARDALGAALVAGSNVTITPNDGADTITISATVPSSYSDEQAQDAFAALIAAGTHSGISFAYNDAGNALSATVAAQSWSQITGKPTLAAVATTGAYSDLTGAPGAYTDEQVRDVIGTALVGGTNVTVTVNDVGDTITIAAAGGTAPVSSVNTKTGAVVLNAADVGATRLSVDGTYTSTYDLDTTPVTPADIGAEQTANKNVANGYAGLNAFSQVLIANLPTGNSAGNVTVGNDSRLSDTRTPTDGTVTDAKVASGAAIAESKLSLASDAVAGTASRRTLGTGAQQAAAGNDSRITGATQKASNLSDLASASTARTNLGLATVAATGSYTDLSNTPTIPAAYTDEQARDALGAALVAGANVTITVNDAADTITVAASGGLTSAQAAGRALILGS